jgi:hypothetical protein
MVTQRLNDIRAEVYKRLSKLDLIEELVDYEADEERLLKVCAGDHQS